MDNHLLPPSPWQPHIVFSDHRIVFWDREQPDGTIVRYARKYLGPVPVSDWEVCHG